MNSDKPQKMIIPCILNILKEYTYDEDHAMRQEEIGKKLKTEYGIDIDRKTLSRNLKTILDYIDEVNCKIKDRTGRILSDEDDDKGAIYTDFYYEHMFTNVEIQAIVSNIVFAKHISNHHKTDIIEKLESLGPQSVRHDSEGYLREDAKYAKEYEELFSNLETLDEAIARKEIVRFQCTSYDDKMKLRIHDRIRYVFPLGIAEKDNDYYLVGLVCGSENESPEDFLKDVHKLIDNVERGSRFLDTFRIDKLRNLETVNAVDCVFQISEADKKIAKKLSLKSFDRTWSNIRDYVSQNSALCPGRSITAKFKVDSDTEEGISDVIDYFGKENVRIEILSDEGQKQTYLFSVNTNDRSMLEFAKTHAGNVTVLQPDYLREELLETFKTAYERLK